MSSSREVARSLTLEAAGDGQRLDLIVAAATDLSRTAAATLIATGMVSVDDKLQKAGYRPTASQQISVTIPAPRGVDIIGEDLPLAIVFEDEHLLVVDKAAGMVVHPAPGNPDGTLVNALLHHCQGKLSGIGGVERPGIVHRLDKDTSGCIVVAKSDVAHQSLVGQFAGRTMEKLYLAVTQGIPKPAKDSIFTHIGRHPVNRQKMAVVNPPGGKTAITDYEILATDASTLTALVLCHLHTGRTHQIRVHLHHKGTALVGDPIYGKPSPQTGRLMLHAWQLTLDHPVTRERLHFEAPIPPEFLHWTAMR